MIMNVNTRSAYTEVLAIIDLLDEDYKSKIPDKLIEFFEKEKSNEHTVEINPDISLEEHSLLPETIDILALVKLSYWCSDENEKQELLNILDENEKDYQRELREKYNPNNIFGGRNEQTAMVKDKKPNFIIEIFEKIRNLFKKKD